MTQVSLSVGGSPCTQLPLQASTLPPNTPSLPREKREQVEPARKDRDPWLRGRLCCHIDLETSLWDCVTLNTA